MTGNENQDAPKKGDPTDASAHPLLGGSLRALHRAAARARQIAAQTGTAVVTERNGRLEREYPALTAPSGQDPMALEPEDRHAALETTIPDPTAFLHALGNLHDARIQDLRYAVEQNTLLVALDDLHASTLGLPEYPGRSPATLVLRDVQGLEVRGALDAPLWILDFAATRQGGSRLAVTVALANAASLVFTCGAFGLRILRGEPFPA